MIAKTLPKVFFDRCLIVALMLSFYSSILPQANNSASIQEKRQEDAVSKSRLEVLKWKRISEQITKDLLEDTNKNSHSERPVILARIASLWWEFDNEFARQLLKKAVSEVTFDSLIESDTEREKRLETATQLIKFIIPLDKILAEKLIKYTLEMKNSVNSNKQIADELIKAALQVVESNPTLAKDLGSHSLKNGQSYLIYRLIMELNFRDAKLGENLFNEALLMIEAFPDLSTSVGFASALSSAVFKTYKGKSLSKDSQKKFLQLLFNLVSVESKHPKAQSHTCNFVSIAASLIAQYEIHFPEKVNIISQKKEKCNSASNHSANLDQTNLSKTELNTVDDYLGEAKNTQNISLKKQYYYRAIEKLYKEKKYEKIISVLEDMNEKDKNAFGDDSWKSWRWEAALRASVEFIKIKNFSGVYRIINNTPQTLRPIVQSALAKEMAKEDEPFAVSLLNDAFKGLVSSEISPKDKAGLLIYLTKQYAEISPYEAINVFRETAKMVNLSDESNPENNPLNDYAPLKESIFLPVFLLETEEINTMQITSNIKQVTSRTRFRFGFLEQSLKKLNEAKLKIEKKN